MKRVIAGAALTALGVAAAHHAQPTVAVKHAAPVKPRKHTIVRDALPIRVSPRPVSRDEQRAPVPRATRVVTEGALFPEPWQSLAECESLRDESWRPDDPSTFRGYFQFLPSTWRSVGGVGDPADASPAEQLYRARLLQARDGWGPWPVCSRMVGLR